MLCSAVLCLQTMAEERKHNSDMEEMSDALSMMQMAAVDTALGLRVENLGNTAGASKVKHAANSLAELGKFVKRSGETMEREAVLALLIAHATDFNKVRAAASAIYCFRCVPCSLPSLCMHCRLFARTS